MTPEHLRNLALVVERPPVRHGYVTVNILMVPEERDAIVAALRFHAHILETTRP